MTESNFKKEAVKIFRNCHPYLITISDGLWIVRPGGTDWAVAWIWKEKMYRLDIKPFKRSLYDEEIEDVYDCLKCNDNLVIRHMGKLLKEFYFGKNCFQEAEGLQELHNHSMS